MRQQNLGGEGAVLAVAAQIAVQPLHDGVDTHQPGAMVLTFGSVEPTGNLGLFFGGGEVGKGDVQLGTLI